MKKIVIFSIAIALITGCSKDYLSSLQNNPNAPTTGVATPQLILPATITGITNIINDWGTYSSMAVWMGYWNGQPGYSAFTNVFNYVMTNTGPQSWDNYYGVLTNLNALVQQSQSVANSNYRDMANVLETICFKNLVDLYNNIPYSQALKGSGDFYPNYDNGSAIYDSLVAKLDVAIADMQANLSNSAVTTPSSEDVMFGGNMSNWIKFANTLKLRLLVMQSNVSAKASYIASEISNTASIGYLTTDALVNPGYNSSKPGNIWAAFGTNPTGGLNVGTGEYGANQAAIDFYRKTQDSRLAYFYTPVTITPASSSFYSVVLPPNFTASGSGHFAGNYCGTQATVAGGSSDIGPGILKSPSQSAVMMTAAESYFLQAEATVLGWLPGGNAAAQSLYVKGIEKSYEFLGVAGGGVAADAAADAYYNQGTSQGTSFVIFPTGVSADSLRHTILQQKWAALNSINILEPYNDWRRTFNPAMNSGYPIVPVSNSATNTHAHMPFRYLYPVTEQNSNGIAWAAAGGATTDAFNDKIFWMK
ncbi:MAG TPA: SusD/RagB family nutrient-binding outer membrane lipoprotein [Chitinophagaceae bacterium]|nr:SusD/RagB family nutrient-binding outer membrane lipoprotein [Chitinophagaceae bacterium]